MLFMAKKLTDVYLPVVMLNNTGWNTIEYQRNLVMLYTCCSKEVADVIHLSCDVS